MSEINIWIDEDEALGQIDIDSAIAYYTVEEILSEITEKEVIENMDIDSLLAEIGEERIREYLEDSE